jgi:hypothetical protein
MFDRKRERESTVLFKQPLNMPAVGQIFKGFLYHTLQHALVKHTPPPTNATFFLEDLVKNFSVTRVV